MKIRNGVRRYSLFAIGTLLAVAGQLQAETNLIKWTYTGYVQGRYTYTDDDSLPSESNFDVKRAVLWVKAGVTEHLGAVIDLQGQPTTKVIEGYAEYVNGATQGRIGLSRIPFGYEVQAGTSSLITLERSQVVNNLLPVGQYGYDRGIYGYYLPAKGLNLGVGVVNGADLDSSSDPNDSKNLVARIGVKGDRTSIGASIYQGKLAQKNTSGTYIAGSEVTAKRFGIDATVKSGPITLISEWLTGKDGTRKSRGGYLTAAYQKKNSKGQPYIRYDLYDPDTSTSDNQFQRLTAGYNYYLAKGTKLTLEYESINDELKPKLNNRISTQLQVSF